VKIALLHESFWPEVGGVQQVMRDQARMLVHAGHQVRVLCGLGLDPGEGYQVLLLPTLAPDYPLNKQVRAMLESGQVDKNFNRYRAVLGEALRELLGDADVTIVHNLFTMHHNLPLTLALHDIAKEHRLIAWTHDLVITNSDYSLPNPTKQPWNLMRTANIHVKYVAVSEIRAAELQAQLRPGADPVVVPNPVDPIRLFGLTPQMGDSYASLDLPSRDFIFLAPAPATPRKNLDFAIDVMKRLVAEGRDPLLLITAPPLKHNPGAERYGTFLRQSLPEELKGHVVFVSDFFPVEDMVLRDLYLLADCLFYPSRQEGFGLPVIEAARFRMPIWCSHAPSCEMLAEDGAIFALETASQLPQAIAWLEKQPTFRQQRRARRLFDPAVIYRDHYAPLLKAWIG
jgi:glycosyltransferase involved in cell wall biosynthesis